MSNTTDLKEICVCIRTWYLLLKKSFEKQGLLLCCNYNYIYLHFPVALPLITLPIDFVLYNP